MIRKLLTFALTHRVATLILVAVLIGCGVWSWLNLQKEAYPDIGDTQVVVITQYPGQAPEDVEQQVTMPLERALNGVPRVIERRSITIFGLSVISLTFEDGVDDYFARQRVMEKINDAVLPAGVNPSLGPLTGPVGEIYRYVIEAPDNYTPMDVRTLQDWVVIPRLLQVPGVADVVNFGGLVKQFHVITSPEFLNRYNLTIQNIIDAINNNNVNTGGNIIRRGGQGFVIRGIGAIRKREDIEDIVVTSVSGVPVLIKNLAHVEEFPSPPTGVLGYTIQSNESLKVDVNSGVQGLIAMRRGENASQVVAGLKERIEDINAHDLPAGVHLRVTYDRSELVNSTIHTVSHTLFEGISIVVIVLIFFIGSIRSALVVAATIPLSMLFAFVMMKITGIPANLLSLGAIDFGIIVDGAVVMVENIMRHYRDATPGERKEGIIHFTLTAAQDVGKEIFFSITIIILAYLPIFTFERVEGKLFSPMAYTLSFAITGSLILALTAIPVFMTFIYRTYFESDAPGSLEWHNPVYTWIAKSYEKAVSVVMKYAKSTVAMSFTIVVIFMIVGFSKIGTEFLPNLDEGAFNIRCFFPVGIAIDEAKQYTPKIREVISNHKEVNVVLTQLGRNDDGTDPYGPNRLEILVGLRDYSTWKNHISKEELMYQMKSDLEQALPGALFSFSQPILDNVTEAVTGSVADLAILVNGPDLKYMRSVADSILNVIKTIPGASESGIEQEGDQAQLAVEVNRESAARYGINVSDIQKMIEAAIGGKPVSKLYDGSKLFDIVVRYEPEYRSSIDAIQHMLVTASSGARIPMSQLASINLIDGPTVIQRESGNRQISVRTNIRERDQGGFVEEAQHKVDATIHLLPGYNISWGGQFENLERASKRLAVVIPITIIIIIVVLFLLLRDVRHVAVAMSCIPFSLIGGILALLLRHYNFTVSAGVGFISLFGVSTMAGVLFVSRVNRLREDYNIKLADAVQQAAVIQLRPLLMAIVLAMFGLIPAAVTQGIGSDVQRPLATVIVGGLASVLILALLVLPALFMVLERTRKNIPPSS
jgi:cobalt-zinc-cadmium resistance protein CzcA